MMKFRKPKKTEHGAVPEIAMRVWEDFLVGQSNDARDEIIIHYQPLVRAIADNIGARVNWKVPTYELISLGQVGLIKAVDAYVPEKGPFKKLASTLIFGHIIDGMRKDDWLPRKYRIAQRAIQLEEYKAGSSLSVKELAKRLEWTEEEVIEAIVHSRRAEMKPLLTPRAISTPSNNGNSDLLTVFLRSFDNLTIDQQAILALKYYDKKSFAEISHELGIEDVGAEHEEAVVSIFKDAERSVLDSE